MGAWTQCQFFSGPAKSPSLIESVAGEVMGIWSPRASAPPGPSPPTLAPGSLTHPQLLPRPELPFPKPRPLTAREFRQPHPKQPPQLVPCPCLSLQPPLLCPPPTCPALLLFAGCLSGSFSQGSSQGRDTANRCGWSTHPLSLSLTAEGSLCLRLPVCLLLSTPQMQPPGCGLNYVPS